MSSGKLDCCVTQQRLDFASDSKKTQIDEFWQCTQATLKPILVAHKLHTSLVSTTDTIAELRGLSAGDSGWFPGTFKSILKADSTHLSHMDKSLQKLS